MIHFSKIFIYLLGVFGLFNNNKPNNAETNLDDFVNKFCIYAFEQYGVSYKYKIAFTDPKISKIFISFEHSSTPTRQKSTILPVKIRNDFLTQLNQSKEIRPYLEEHPFPHKLVSVEVMYERIEQSDIFSTTSRGNDITIYQCSGKDTIKEVYKDYALDPEKSIDECEKNVEVLPDFF